MCDEKARPFQTYISEVWALPFVSHHVPVIALSLCFGTIDVFAVYAITTVNSYTFDR